MNTVLITQVRMGSSRLPGKVMKPIGGRPLLDYHLDRIEGAGRPVVVATTVHGRDDVLVDHCAKRGLPTYRGSEQDVLRRYRNAARLFDCDNVVRVTSDCPLLDPDLLKEGIGEFERGDWDFLANNHPQRTYPHGMDYAIFTRDLLEEVEHRAKRPRHREHVPTFMQEQDSIRKTCLRADEDLSHIRVTVDYPGDLEVIRTLIEEYSAHEKGYRAIVDCYREAFFQSETPDPNDGSE